MYMQCTSFANSLSASQIHYLFRAFKKRKMTLRGCVAFSEILFSGRIYEVAALQVLLHGASRWVWVSGCALSFDRYASFVGLRLLIVFMITIIC